MKLNNVVLAAACAAALSAGSAVAQAVFLDVQGTEMFVSHIEGVVNCRGGVEPTGDFFSPCGLGIPGTIRNRQVGSQVTFPSPFGQFSGASNIVVNVNFDKDGQGPMWGTFELALAGGG